MKNEINENKALSQTSVTGSSGLFITNEDNMLLMSRYPDNYCDILTRNKAASLLGDGWTLPIVEHIFSFMHKT